MIQKETRYYSNRLELWQRQSDYTRRMIPCLRERANRLIQVIADAAECEANSSGEFSWIPLAMKPARPAAEREWRTLVAAYRQAKRMSIFFDMDQTSLFFVIKFYGPGRGGPLLAMIKSAMGENLDNMEIIS